MLLGPDGAADGLGPGGLAIDMSTIAPTASRSIGERLSERGIAFLDAPVTGSRTRGRGRHAHDHGRRPRARPSTARGRCSRRWASWSLHVGPQGHGSMIKLINNTMAAVNAAALAEGIVLAPRRRARPGEDAAGGGLGLGRLGDAARSSPGRWSSGDYEPLFKLEHMLKDVRH